MRLPIRPVLQQTLHFWLEPLLILMMDVPSDRVPGDVLVVEDDPIIALDFEDTILGFGARTVRTAGSVTRAL